MNVSKVVKYVISLAIAAILLYFSFRSVDWDEFISGIVCCRWGYVIGAMAASIAAFWFRSERWRILLSPFDRKMQSLTTFNGVNIGYLANFVFPRIGEVIRCGFVSRRSRQQHQDDPENAVTFDRTLGTVLLSRTWDILVVLILLTVLLISRWYKFGGFFVSKMWEPFQERFSFSFWWVVSGGILIVAAFLATCYFLRYRNGWCGKVCSFFKGISDGFKSCLKMDNKVMFIVHTILLWTMYWLMSRCIILAMPALDFLSGIDAWFICLAGSVAWMIPVPGGFGAYHGIVAMALASIYEVDYGTGLLCATLNHEAQAITMIICGAVSYFIEITRK